MRNDWNPTTLDNRQNELAKETDLWHIHMLTKKLAITSITVAQPIHVGLNLRLRSGSELVESQIPNVWHRSYKL
ncbi:MAG: hypothetical protein IPQ18_05780 [Saprospiraceae bacterium]|nr:hypothetical protein [Saprospiraceae bacterium]